MALIIRNTPAKVREPKKVREIIKAYLLENIKIHVKKQRGEWILKMEDDRNPDAFGPAALRWDSMPDPSDYPDENNWFEVIHDQEFPLIQKTAKKGGFHGAFSRWRMMNRCVFSW